MAVTVDEAGQHGLAADVDDLAAGGDFDLAAPTNGPEAIAVDHDHRILDRRTSGAVDQSAALEYGHLLRLCGAMNERNKRKCCGCERPSHHILPGGLQ
jgi:hypothetical protein